MKLKILLVDNHILFREGLASVLSEEPGLTISGQTGCVEEALEKINQFQPDVVLMNIVLPDGSGLEAIRSILNRSPKTKIVILTEQEEETDFLSAMRRGAKGFLRKDIPVSELIRSLHGLEKGELAISRVMTKKLVDELHRVGKANGHVDSKIDVLTLRELEVLKTLGDGCSNGEIADQLSISRNTVRVYVHKILKKLNFRSRREASQYIRALDYGENHHQNSSL
jgi:two-component system NarL family response regulator